MIEERLRSILHEESLRLGLVEMRDQSHLELRRELRGTAAEKAGELAAVEVDPSVITDLTRPLVRIGPLFCSISHSTARGGVLVTKRACGFDLESIARVKESTVLRVSQATELRASPTPAALWGAKEAAFKALLHFAQPQTLSQIRIGDWEDLPLATSRSGTFRLLNAEEFRAPEGIGCVFEDEKDIVAAFLF